MTDIKELQDFAIWMIGCGYDFTQHEYFVKNRHLLTDNHKSKQREIFYAGFDEGYTSPLEQDGKPITEDQYNQGREDNFQSWINDNQ